MMERVPLGDVLMRSNSWIELDPQREYKEVTVRLWGRGVALRKVVAGSEVAGSRRLQVRPRQFIASRIDARNGAFGLIPGDLDGAVVTNDFPVFIPRENRLLPEYLGWLSKTRDFVSACAASSEGTTNRVRLKEEKFLAIRIPLPLMAEQRRIVAKIEHLAAKIEEARVIQSCISVEARVIWRQTLNREFAHDKHAVASLDDCCEAIVDNLHSTPRYLGDDYPCIRSQDIGWGTINYTTALRTDVTEFEERTRRAEPQRGDVLYVREGDIGRCGVVDGSHRFSLGQRVMMFRPRLDVMDSKFFLYQMMSPPVHDAQVLSGKTGTTSQHVNIKHLREVRLTVPPLDQQRRIVAHLDALQAKFDQLKSLQSQTAAELDALLPSILDKAFKGELLPDLTSRSADPIRIQQEKRDEFLMLILFAAWLAEHFNPRRIGGDRLRMAKALTIFTGVIQRTFGWHAYRYPLGPHNPELLQRIEREAQRLGLIEITTQSRANGDDAYRYVTKPVPKELKQQFCEQLGDAMPLLKRIVPHLQQWTARDMELYGTTYAVWNDFLLDKINPSDEQIITGVLNWSEKKEEKFTAADVRSAFAALRRNGLAPMGTGEKTRRLGLFG